MVYPNAHGADGGALRGGGCAAHGEKTGGTERRRVNGRANIGCGYLWLGSPPPQILVEMICWSCWQREGRPDWTHRIGETARMVQRVCRGFEAWGELPVFWKKSNGTGGRRDRVNSRANLGCGYTYGSAPPLPPKS